MPWNLGIHFPEVGFDDPPTASPVFVTMKNSKKPQKKTAARNANGLTSVKHTSDSSRFYLSIPLLPADADNWSRASKAAGKVIREWASDVLAKAAGQPCGRTQKRIQMDLPPDTGNRWTVEIARGEFDNLWNASRAMGLTIEQWAYCELKSAWSRVVFDTPTTTPAIHTGTESASLWPGNVNYFIEPMVHDEENHFKMTIPIRASDAARIRRIKAFTPEYVGRLIHGVASNEITRFDHAKPWLLDCIPCELEGWKNTGNLVFHAPCNYFKRMESTATELGTDIATFVRVAVAYILAVGIR